MTGSIFAWCFTNDGCAQTQRHSSKRLNQTLLKPEILVEGKLEPSFSAIRMYTALAKRVLSNYNRQHFEINTDDSWKRGEKTDG